MLKRLHLTDKPALLELIKADETNNLQFYEYVDYLKQPDPRFGFIGYFDDGRLTGAMYYSPFNMGITVLDPEDVPRFRKKIMAAPSAYLFGRSDILSRLGDLPERKVHLYRYGYLPIKKGHSPNRHTETDCSLMIHRAGQSHISSIKEFYRDKDIMIEIPDRIDNIVQSGSAFFVREGERVVSAALAHSETEHYALIGAVYTDESAQGKGYGKQCLKALVHHLHRKGKTPYLFYDSSLPHLHKLYKSFSFVHTRNYWMMY